MAEIILKIVNVDIEKAEAIAEEVCDEFNCMDGDEEMTIVAIEPTTVEE